MTLFIPSACSNDGDPENNDSNMSDGDAVEFTIMLPNKATDMYRSRNSTRAFSTLDNRWIMNQEVAICEGSTVYKYKASKSSESGGDRVSVVPASSANNCYYWSTLQPNRTFSAWYPYSDAKPTNVAGATDQRSNTYYLGTQGTMTDDAYNLLDLLYAPDVNVGFKQSVNLDFYHQMCRIIVTVNSAATKGAKPVTSVIFGKNNVAAGGTVTLGYTGDPLTATASWTVSQTTSVNMRLNNAISSAKQYTYECIVPPQTLPGSAVLFQITTKATDNTLTTTDYIPQNLYQDAPNFLAGYQYNFMLTLSRQGQISISTLQVSNWATENVSGLNATVPDAGY